MGTIRLLFSRIHQVVGVVLILSGMGLFASACQSAAKKPPTPVVPITGGNPPSENPQATSSPTTIYMPLVLSTPTPIAQPSLGRGKVYFVATSGNDSNPGTAASPWRSLGKGVSNLKAGDTLYIKSGTYVQTSPLVISESGNPTNGPITISTAPGEARPAVITGDTNGDGLAETPASSIYSALIELRGSYLQVLNLNVIYSKGRGIKSGGKFNIIRGNDIHHIWDNGIYIYGPDTIVEKNTVWRTADSNYCNGVTGRQCNGNWVGGIAWGDPHDATVPGVSPRIIIRNNTVFNTSGEGLLCMHTDDGLIEGNVVYDNWAVNIDLDQCSNTSVQKNLVYATSDTVWWKNATRPSTGIMLSNEGIKDSSGNIYPIGHDRKVINNIVVGTGSNFYFWAGDGTGGGLVDSALKNDLIAYNTLVNTSGSDGAGLKIDAGPHANTRIFNNIVLETKNIIASAGSVDGITFAHNLWSKSPPSSFSSPTDIVGNPLLVDPNHAYQAGSLQPEWYKLAGNSPAAGRGLELSEVSDDYWGNLRKNITDIGASEIAR